MVHEGTGELVSADCYDKALYKLHASFNEKAKQSMVFPTFQTCSSASLTTSAPHSFCSNWLIIEFFDSLQRSNNRHSAAKKMDGASSI